MKKLTKDSFMVLRSTTIVLNEQEQQAVKGGDYWSDHGYWTTDPSGNSTWTRTVSHNPDYSGSGSSYSSSSYDYGSGSSYGSSGYPGGSYISSGGNFSFGGLEYNQSGVGFLASCRIDGNVSQYNNIVSVSASIFAPTMYQSGTKLTGIIELIVNGQVVQTKNLTLNRDGYFCSPGSSSSYPLGEASFNLSGYTGSISIKLSGGYTNNSSGTGVAWGSSSNNIIYSTNR